MGYLCEVSLEASRLRAVYDFKHAMGARDDAVVVRGRSARKLETVFLLTIMDAIRDQAAQAMLRMGGWPRRTLTGLCVGKGRRIHQDPLRCH